MSEQNEDPLQRSVIELTRTNQQLLIATQAIRSPIQATNQTMQVGFRMLNTHFVRIENQLLGIMQIEAKLVLALRQVTTTFIKSKYTTVGKQTNIPPLQQGLIVSLDNLARQMRITLTGIAEKTAGLTETGADQSLQASFDAINSTINQADKSTKKLTGKKGFDKLSKQVIGTASGMLSMTFLMSPLTAGLNGILGPANSISSSFGAIGSLIGVGTIPAVTQINEILINDFLPSAKETGSMLSGVSTAAGPLITIFMNLMGSATGLITTAQSLDNIFEEFGTSLEEATEKARDFMITLTGGKGDPLSGQNWLTRMGLGGPF